MFKRIRKIMRKRDPLKPKDFKRVSVDSLIESFKKMSSCGITLAEAFRVMSGTMKNVAIKTKDNNQETD